MKAEDHIARAEELLHLADTTGITYPETIRAYAALASAHLQMAACLHQLERERKDDELREELHDHLEKTRG